MVVVYPAPLHNAAARGQKHVVQMLIATGAVLDAENVYGRTPEKVRPRELPACVAVPASPACEPCLAVPVLQTTACTVLLAIVPDLSSCGWDCLCRWQGRKGSRKWHRSSLPLARPRRKPTPLTGAQRSRRNLQNFQPTSHGTSLSHTRDLHTHPTLVWWDGTSLPLP